MPTSIKRIGIITGGGDCPGINAVIRAVAKTAIYKHNLQVMGIEDGFLGLVENRISPLTSLHVSGILNRGGTILGTNNRCNPSKHYVGDDEQGNPIFQNRLDECVANLKRHEIEALIVIGGDGTMACAAPLVQKGINCIGVPKTIDNDILGTDITFGFHTAVATATDALDKLHSTAASHHRVMVCEVMGRNAGWIALTSGVASGSDVILIPEVPFSLDVITDFVNSRMHRGRGFSIIACSEGAKPAGGDQMATQIDPKRPDPVRLGGIGAWVANEIEQRTGIETRHTVLGHVQRGGSPVAQDRILATLFGHHAMELLMGGAVGRMVVTREGRLQDADLCECAKGQRLVPPDHPLIRAARSIRTSFGEYITDAGHGRKKSN
ncbi:MAG: ATP-dependent 6-phosphofructokinase [Planctomycetota bacterium]|nr:ATP-dependent 6-phosphofructokinase [Planctomycetota bacterium]